jgi:DNA-binding beta-propeller fold protein YncE
MRFRPSTVILVFIVGACSNRATTSHPASPTTLGSPHPSESSSPSPDIEAPESGARISLSGGTATALAVADGALWVTHFEDGVLSRVDPAGGVETGTSDVGPNGTSMTALGAKLWITRESVGAGQSVLAVVDPSSGRVEQVISLPDVCCQTASAGGSVWAVDPRGTLLRLDPAAGEVVGKTSVELDALNGHIDLAGDDRGLWIASDTTRLTRVDPNTGKVAERVDVGGGVPMTLDGDLLWGASPHHLWAVDPATGRVAVTFELEDTIETFSIAVTENAIWLGARRPGYVGTVRRYDLTSHVLTGQADVALPARLVFAFGVIWVLDAESNELLRFDP